MTAPYWADEEVTLYLGRCEDVLPGLPAESVDAVVTDPPAAIAFMGREWDSDRGGRDRWVGWLAGCMEAAGRVLKPGGHLLVWSIPRTSGWTQWALEDAGFEVRDCVVHLFGSGFPKSRDIAKDIDRMAGAEREVIGSGRKSGPGALQHRTDLETGCRPNRDLSNGHIPAVTAPATPEAARWEGWGTALKPGQEMWWLARKPLAAGSVAANVLEWGTGAINVDGCRVAHASDADRAESEGKNRHADFGSGPRDNHVFGADERDRADQGNYDGAAGRWPTNVVFTHSASCGDDGPCAPDCPVGELDRQSGVTSERARVLNRNGARQMDGWGLAAQSQGVVHGDTGGASRFYPVFKYQAKAPASERPRLDDGTAHETVKPLGFIRWAVRLVTPPGGTVLDMFAGSGPVGEACVIEGFRCVLIEKERKSADLIRKRLSKPIQPVMFGLEA